MKKMALGRLIGGTALAFTLSAASQAWPQMGGGPYGADWEGFNKLPDSQRYSPLEQIDKSNADKLVEVCRVKVGDRGTFETGPVVVGGSMFVTTPADTYAIDPTNCKIKWHNSYTRSQEAMLQVNRGVAYYHGLVFRGTDDARLIALDAETGKEVWRNVIGDAGLGEYISGAPIAWNGLVIAGTAGSEFGVRARIAAYDAVSGREVWRFNAVPIGKELGANTWKDTKWALHGGGGTWSSFSIDPATAELFIPVGNPVPDYSPDDRRGDNLFTNSALVLDANTGKVLWWYQLIPNDSRDYDLAATPMLFRNSKYEQMMAVAAKDGILRVISRDTHKQIFEVPVTTVDNPMKRPTPEGIKGCPGANGGVLWNGPAFDPKKMTIFTDALDLCMTFKSEAGQKYAPRGINNGGTYTIGDDKPMGWLTAVNADTGEVRWKYHSDSPMLSGVTPTAGGITLAGDNAGNFLVFDSDNGSVLAKMATGGAIGGGVVTYERGDKQYVAMASGNTSYASAGLVGQPSIIIMALAPEVLAQMKTGPDPVRGRQLFGQMCSSCHGGDGAKIDGKNLREVGKRMNQAQVETFILNPSGAMPKLFNRPKGQQQKDLDDIAAFVVGWYKRDR